MSGAQRIEARFWARGRNVAALLLCALLWLVARAEADEANAFQPPAFNIAEHQGPIELRRHVGALTDREGKLSLADVRRVSAKSHFKPVPNSLNFGFTTSAVWLRLEAFNPRPSEERWLLEATYSMLDYVTLYVVHQDGRVEQHDTGDMRAFSSRDVADASFAFEVENAPRETLTCYLRLQTSGSLRATLVAWQRTSDYLDHYHRHYVVLWMFYGALFVMLLFNLGVFALIGQREYLVYSALLVALWSVQFTLAGHTSQFLLNDYPALANRVLPCAISVVMFLIAAFAYVSLAHFEELRSESRYARKCLPFFVALLAFASLAPLWLAIRAVLAAALVVTLVAPYLLHKLRKKQNPQLAIYFVSWYCLLFAVPLHVLRVTNVIPPFPLADWVVQIGITLHGVVTSLALATRLKLARDELGTLNRQLSRNVTDLELALQTAEQATDEARRATRVKDDFMATMSHELRTPLNAIINVPQGLLEDFPELRAASCQACQARFLLDADDVLDKSTSCAECLIVGSLRELTVTKYQGEPAHTARFLRKIERSGKHLLQMVNGVLDFSKMEAGRFSLSLMPVELAPLLSEAADELAELARAKQLTLTLQLDGTLDTLSADPLRLKQVLLNLLANAIKFSEAGGRVHLRWQSEPGAELLSVADCGIGIAAKDHERIFNSFEQVHQGDTRRYGGTGLGLSISRSLVRMHGGELWVESTLGEGATFWVRLPHAGNAAATMQA